MRIPYRPLSERMLQEPFWLGLITVFVVLAVIGLVWCAKRHFPEKIEKLLQEEADRNRRNNKSLNLMSETATNCFLFSFKKLPICVIIITYRCENNCKSLEQQTALQCKPECRIRLLPRQEHKNLFLVDWVLENHQF